MNALTALCLLILAPFVLACLVVLIFGGKKRPKAPDPAGVMGGKFQKHATYTPSLKSLNIKAL